MLILQVLSAAHDNLGHNGFLRTYAAFKRVFYWKGMKENIRDHCKMCATCTLHRSENIKFKRKIFCPSKTDRETAQNLYNRALEVDRLNTLHDYMMATQEVEQAIVSTTKDDWKRKPGPNNPEEARKFVEAVEQAMTSFAKAIEKNDPDAVENAYADFVGKYYELLSNVEDYYTDASIEGVSNIREDKQCKILLQPSIREAEEQKLCPDPRVMLFNRHTTLLLQSTDI